jgi:hypothetical protein
MVMLAALSFSVQGCGGVGRLVGGKMSEWKSKETIQVNSNWDSTAVKVEQIAKEFDMAYIAPTCQGCPIGLNIGGGSRGQAAFDLTGKQNYRNITLSLIENGTKWNIEVHIIANYGINARMEADDLLLRFKNSLLK